MGKQIKFSFDKGDSFIVDLLEEEAPETCRIIWEMLEKPWREKMILLPSVLRPVPQFR